MVHKVTSTRMKIDLNGAEGVETQRIKLIHKIVDNAISFFDMSLLLPEYHLTTYIESSCVL